MTASCRNRTSPITCARASRATKRGRPRRSAGSRSRRATRRSSQPISTPIRARASPARRPCRSASGRSAISARPICKHDIDNFKAALAGVKVAEAFLPANTPGTIEHWMANEHYKNDEEFVFAIADAMHEEYKAITDAGLLLQIDDPDLPDGWNCLPRHDRRRISQIRDHAGRRAEPRAARHPEREDPAPCLLGQLPRAASRRHSLEGHHRPHLPVKAGSYSIEASNPCHEHEWRVFEEVKLPQGATLVPGVIGHCTDFIEHPDLVAERLVRYAKLVGRENVLAGTDCGIGTRVGHARSAGPSSRRWPKARAAPPKSCGREGPLPPLRASRRRRRPPRSARRPRRQSARRRPSAPPRAVRPRVRPPAAAERRSRLRPSTARPSSSPSSGSGLLRSR